MTMESKYEYASQKPELTHNRKVAKRSVFISHSHADRKLADALKSLVQDTYSGIIDSFVSSDPAPGGGIQPGDEWFPRIQSELLAAEAVWVLATKTSIERPWIYWEAGLGRATCPGGIVVLRVGVSEGEVPSPLNQFQSYDGGVCGPGGISELAAKVGDQIGMNLRSDLVESTTAEWMSFVESYEPDPEATVTDTVSPEQVSRLDGVIVRLETAADAVSRSSPPLPAISANRVPTRVPGRPRTLRERIEQSAEVQRRFEARREKDGGLLVSTLGENTMIWDDADQFFTKVNAAPESTSIVFGGFDFDGDARFAVAGDGDTTTVYLKGQCLLELEASRYSGRAGTLAKQVQQAVEEAEAGSNNT